MSEPTPRPRNLSLAIALALLVGAVIILVALEWGTIVGSRTAPPETPPPATSGVSSTPGAAAPAAASRLGAPPPYSSVASSAVPLAPRAFAASAIPAPAVDRAEIPVVAAALGRPDLTARDDVATLAALFTSYIEQFHELPVGSNAEITAALRGDNPRGYAALAPDHAAINAAGELVDRWGTPYFFHQLSSTTMEVRSSGPDRRPFTPDDILWPAAAPAPDLLGSL